MCTQKGRRGRRKETEAAHDLASILSLLISLQKLFNPEPTCRNYRKISDL